MREDFDLVVVGAGPGGMAAAATASETGARVCLIDDNPEVGGQVWRSSVQEGVNGAVAKWLLGIETGRVTMRTGWRVVAASSTRGQSPGALRVEREGQYNDIGYSALILATGARELFLPFPGWTLPGVYGVGGLQAFVKAGFDISGKRVVVAGTGPLLLAVAAGLRGAGAQILAVVEQAPFRRLAQFSFGLLFGHAGKMVQGLGYGLRSFGTPYHTGSWVTNAGGEERLKTIIVSNGSRLQEIDTDLLAVGFHLIPNTELAQLLHCELDAGYVRADALQQTSVERIYCVGEATGIGGIEKAQIEGRIAALAACGQVERARFLSGTRDRQVQFSRGLATAFRLREELRALAKDQTVVCRCEDVHYGNLSGCRSWREAKLHLRCGMGPCQGRVCGAATQFLFGWDSPQPRPPLFPVEVATLGGLRAEQDDNQAVTQT